MRIVIARDARKVLSRTQAAKARDIRQAIAGVAADPSARNPNLRPLRGVRNGFRIRVGDWRVSYTLDRAAGILDVYEIAPRGGAYR
jgi:mRNA interferase RelE/StbE